MADKIQDRDRQNRRCHLKPQDKTDDIPRTGKLANSLAQTDAHCRQSQEATHDLRKKGAKRRRDAWQSDPNEKPEYKAKAAMVGQKT